MGRLFWEVFSSSHRLGDEKSALLPAKRQMSRYKVSMALLLGLVESGGRMKYWKPLTMVIAILNRANDQRAFFCSLFIQWSNGKGLR